MIRLVHFADLHLGVENYGRIDPSTGLSTRLSDFLRAFDRVIDFALDPGNEVDLVVFAGDAFRTRDPSPTHQREFARRIRALSRAGVPTVLLVGNHDIPMTTRRAHALEIFDTLEVEHVLVIRKPGVWVLETAHGRVQIAALPWVVPAMLLAREEYHGRSFEEIHALLVGRVEAILYGDGGLAGQLDPALPHVLVAHASVQGAVYGSERSVMLGGDLVLPRSLLTHEVWDYVALGHIHRHQVVAEDPPVIYAGSVERIDFGEEKEDKGFVVADVERGRATWRFCSTEPRRFVTVRVDVNREGGDPTAQIVERVSAVSIDDAVVRLQIGLDEDQRGLVRERELFEALSGAFHVASIGYEVRRAVRRRWGDGTDVAALSPLEVLERYLRLKEVPEERREALLKRAEAIVEEVERDLS